MTEHREIDNRAEAFFQELWKRGDPWQFDSSEFEDRKYTRQIAMLNSRHYPRVLEIGCGGGAFTRRIKAVADYILAVDIAAAAIELARQRGGEGIDYRRANVMDLDLRIDEPWDLIVMSETIYYLGWLYPFFDVAWLGAKLFDTTRNGGRLLMANTQGGVGDALLRPWIIQTYRDLFLNVGFTRETEEVFVGEKNGADIEVLITLFTKKSSVGSATS